MNEVEEIKERLNIVDFIGEYVRLSRAGSSYKGLCPFHNEKSPSFTVSEERQMFHCFGCQKGGDVFTFLMEMEGLDFREALEVLSERTGVELKKIDNTKQITENETTEKIEKSRIYELLELSVRLYEKQLLEGQGKEKALTYLRERGMDDETLKKFRIGFAPSGWENIKKFLLSRGYSDGEIRLSGLLVEKEGGGSYDRFRERIMFPIFDALGRVVGYSARVLPGSDEEGAKYINTPETLVYHKSRAIYGLFESKQAIKEKKYVVIVEGNMDVLAMHKAGFENTVAVSGTALTQEHLKILKRYAQEIFFFFDMDSAGQSAALKSVSLACSLDISSKMITISEGKDAADMVLSNENGLQKALSQAMHSVEYFFSVWEKENDMTSVKGKRNFSEKSLELIASLVNEVEISHWMAYISDRVGVEIYTLYTMLSRYKNREKVFYQTSQQEQSDEGQGNFENFSREMALSLRVLMFFFSYPDLWRRYDTQENSFLRLIHLSFQDVLRLGRLCEYSYEALRMRLADSMRKVLEKEYHDFQMEVLTKTLPEDEVKREVDLLFEHIQKEQKKSVLEGIEKELYEAEKSNDKHRAKELRAKMNQMIQQA
jgi:DNA primase